MQTTECSVDPVMLFSANKCNKHTILSHKMERTFAEAFILPPPFLYKLSSQKQKTTQISHMLKRTRRDKIRYAISNFNRVESGYCKMQRVSRGHVKINVGWLSNVYAFQRLNMLTGSCVRTVQIGKANRGFCALPDQIRQTPTGISTCELIRDVLRPARLTL